MSLDVSGYSVLLIDTAGIHSQTTDFIEKLGIQKSKDHAQEANMVILMADAQHLLNIDNIDLWLQEYAQNMKVQCNNCLVYVNKIDVVSENQVLKLKKISQASNWSICFGSCKVDNGLMDLMEMFENYLQKLLVISKCYLEYITFFNFFFRCGNPNFEHPRCSQARHRYCLINTLDNIHKYLEISKIDENIDIAAHPLRKATVYVGKITGHVSTEEMLNVIFSKFCIGK